MNFKNFHKDHDHYDNVKHLTSRKKKKGIELTYTSCWGITINPLLKSPWDFRAEIPSYWALQKAFAFGPILRKLSLSSKGTSCRRTDPRGFTEIPKERNTSFNMIHYVWYGYKAQTFSPKRAGSLSWSAKNATVAFTSRELLGLSSRTFGSDRICSQTKDKV
jgi:hypothetical protein